MKLAIIVRKDLGMSCGKIAGQVGHASVMAFACPPNVDSNMKILRWYGEGQKKIVLKTETEESLNIIAKKAENENLVVHHIHDFGLTQIEPNTLTCIAIGPDEDEKIDAVIKELKLL